MAKKRKTLPPEFTELLNKKDVEGLKAVMNRCEPNASGGYSKHNAFGFTGLTEEFARWLIGYGTDINMPDTFGYSPLHHLAMSPGSAEQIELYLELGADIQARSHDGCTPLHNAADHHSPDNVSALLSHGAAVSAADRNGLTPLAFALIRCSNMDIPDMVKISEILINAGAQITPEIQQYITDIGQNFEFHRPDFNPDFLPQIEEGLNSLYQLFHVPPVPVRRFHDGISPITVTSADWKDQHQELWELLVPGSGACKTVQGEVIRITGRVNDELMRNGGGNWDAQYRKMVNALLKHLESGNSLDPSSLEEAKSLASGLLSDSSGKSSVRLCRLAVDWVLKNPVPVPLGPVDYRR